MNAEAQNEIVKLAKEISLILLKNFDPYVVVEINGEGVKMTSVNLFEPTSNESTKVTDY